MRKYLASVNRLIDGMRKSRNFLPLIIRSALISCGRSNEATVLAPRRVFPVIEYLMHSMNACYIHREVTLLASLNAGRSAT